MHTRPTLRNVSQGIGAAALLLSQSAHSDEALLPPGATLERLPGNSISAVQNTFATQLTYDITPDPSLTPSNTVRWLLVKTDSGLSVTLPENYTGTLYHFGQQEKFFVRFDRSTGLPEISFDMHTWQTYNSGAPVNISREDQMTFLKITEDIQSLNTLTQEKQTLNATLAVEQGELQQVQNELNGLRVDLTLTDYERALTASDLASQESTRNTLVNTMKPGAQLRTDTHPIAASTNNDTTKTNGIQTALNTYDMSASASQGLASSPLTTAQSGPRFAPQHSPMSTFVPPTAADVQSTITTLTNELSRIQAQITTVNSQITAKQGEITATENEIVELQNLIESLESDKTYWQNQYNYWKGEYNRLHKIHEDAYYASVEMWGYYRYAKEDLEAIGRNDVPDIDDPNIVNLLAGLKNRMIAEYNAIPITPKTGTTSTATGLPDEPYGPFNYGSRQGELSPYTSCIGLNTVKSPLKKYVKF